MNAAPALSVVGVLSILIVISAIGLLVLAIVLTRRSGKPGETSCGRCGYGVEGLTAFRCPECGSDLRRVGILAAGMRRAVPPYLIATMQIVFVTVVLVIPMSITMSRALTPRMLGTTLRTEVTLGLAEPTEALDSIVCVRSDFMPSGAAPSGAEDDASVEISWTDQSGVTTGSLVVDLADHSVTIFGVEQADPFSPASVEAFLPARLDAPTRDRLAGDLHMIVTTPGAPPSRTPSGVPTFSSVTTNSSQVDHWAPLGLTPYLVGSAWGAAWIAMVVYVFKRAQKKHRAMH